MTDDFHFDTEIIVKLNHQGYRIKEVPIPTYYGGEICYVNGMKYARDVVRAVFRYRLTLSGRLISPEYSEYAGHYPLKESRYSSHHYFRRLAAKGQDVLDVGCGEGYFASRIAAKGNRVVGVDCLSTPKCAAAMELYIPADLDAGLADAFPGLGKRRFDLVLLQDVLEHLRVPEQLLRDCHNVLKSHGRIAVSVPNVANITVRIGLLLGRFDYRPRGILDRSHLRFFTRRSARRLLEETGYEVLRQYETVMPIELALGLSSKNPIMRAVNQTLRVLTACLPGLLGYQTILLARARAADTAFATPILHVQRGAA
jgi:2-polyprenyl-3-methyl-5-hydroxy-6-metoxy-1,4-benzoquinol methylase